MHDAPVPDGPAHHRSGVTRAALITPNDEARDLDAVAAALSTDPADAFKRVIYTESHDEDANGSSRVPEEIWPGYADSWPSRKRAALGAALVLTAPGIPMLFQGQELVEGSWFTDEEPLDWSKRHQQRSPQPPPLVPADVARRMADTDGRSRPGSDGLRVSADLARGVPGRSREAGLSGG